MTTTLESAPEPKVTSHRVPAAPAAILGFIAGVVALVLETAWIRVMGLALGNTVYANAAVIAAILSGLALGSLVLGRLADTRRNAIAFFGSIAVAAGLASLLTLGGARIAATIFGGLFRSAGGAAPSLGFAGFFLALLVVGIPAALLGATVPVLTRHLESDTSRASARAAALYGWNALGGVIGAVLAGYVLIEQLGLRGTIVSASLAMLAAGASALLAGRGRASSQPGHASALPPPGDRVPASHAPGRPGMVFAALALSGFTALAYEVLWARAAVFAIDATVVTTTTLLAVSLLGVALGSFLGAPLASRTRHPLFALGAIEGLVGLAALGSVTTLARWPDLAPAVPAIRGGGTFTGWSLERLFESMVIVLVPAILLGATFPVAVRALTGSARKSEGTHGSGRDIGLLCALNAAGAVVGGFLAALILAPLLGTDRSLLAIAFVNILLAVALIHADSGIPRFGRVAASAATVLVFLIGRGLLPEKTFSDLYAIRDPGSELVTFREGAQAIVTVHQYPGVRTLSVNGVTAAGTDLVLSTAQRLQGHLPCFLHPSPKSALEIGAGAGETARILLLHGLERVDAIDVTPDIQPLAGELSADNAAALADPRCHRITSDGHAFARYMNDRYDVVVNDPSHPALGGGASLFTREHFLACRERLNEGGLVATWVPLFALTPADLATIVRTFLDVFPHATLWYAGNSMNRHALLVGSAADGPVAIDWSSIVLRMARPEIAADLASLNLGEPLALLACFVAADADLATLAAGGHLHTDDRPVLEYDVARVSGRDPEIVATLVETVSRARVSAYPLLTNFTASGADSTLIHHLMERDFAATTQVLRGIALDIRGVSSEPEKAYHAALAINPDDRHARFFLQDKAVQEASLTQAVAANPEESGLRLELARMHLKQGKFREALDGMLAAVPEAERDASIWYDIGLCHARLGNAADAEKAYREAIRLNPALPEPHVNLGALLQRTGRFEDAVAEYKVALSLNADHPEANYNLGVAYAQKGLHGDAIPCFEKAVAVRPAYQEAWYNLGVSRATARDLPAAIDAWEHCVALDPANQTARANIARARLMMSQPPSPAPDSARPPTR